MLLYDTLFMSLPLARSVVGWASGFIYIQTQCGKQRRECFAGMRVWWNECRLCPEAWKISTHTLSTRHASKKNSAVRKMSKPMMYFIKCIDEWWLSNVLHEEGIHTYNIVDA